MYFIIEKNANDNFKVRELYLRVKCLSPTTPFIDTVNFELNSFADVSEKSWIYLGHSRNN